jgi:putative copper resistance protein D
LLVFFSLWTSLDRLEQLAKEFPQFHAAEVDIIFVPNDIVDYQNKSGRIDLGLPIVTEGSTEIAATYALFARSFADEKAVTEPRHVEFLIDKQGYIRARWLPAESEAWRKIATLLTQVELLHKEKPRAPAPDEHVH